MIAPPVDNPPILSDTADVLARLRAADEAWFWFCDEAAGPALLVTPFREDPAMVGLLDQVGKVAAPRTAPHCFGVLRMGPTGRVLLDSPEPGDVFLPRIASWCRRHVARNPALGTLAHARWQGGATVMELPEAWEGVVAPRPPDTPVLAELGPDESAWIWVVPRGPQGLPVLVATREDDDPQGTQLSQQARRISRTPLQDGSTGMAHVVPSGKLVLVLDDKDELLPVLSALATRAAFQRLDGAIALPQADGALADATLIRATDVSRQEILLATAEPRLYFCLTEGDTPHLFIEPTREVLAETVRREAADPAVSGQLRLGPEKRWVFVTREAPEDFLKRVARFVLLYDQAAPGLRRLRDASVMTQDADGPRPPRADPAAWRAIRPR